MNSLVYYIEVQGVTRVKLHIQMNSRKHWAPPLGPNAVYWQLRILSPWPLNFPSVNKSFSQMKSDNVESDNCSYLADVVCGMVVWCGCVVWCGVVWCGRYVMTGCDEVWQPKPWLWLEWGVRWPLSSHWSAVSPDWVLEDTTWLMLMLCSDLAGLTLLRVTLLAAIAWVLLV